MPPHLTTKQHKHTNTKQTQNIDKLIYLGCDQPKRIVYNSDYKDTNFYKNGSGSSINSTSLWKVSLYQTGSNVSG